MATPQEPDMAPDIASTAYARALESVVEIMTSIKTTLNIDVNVCQGCGQEHRDDWNQWQAYEALSGAITRAQKANGLIQTSLTPSHL
jgi:GTP cyclohydrolase III